MEGLSHSIYLLIEDLSEKNILSEKKRNYGSEITSTEGKAREGEPYKKMR